MSHYPAFSWSYKNPKVSNEMQWYRENEWVNLVIYLHCLLVWIIYSGQHYISGICLVLILVIMYNLLWLLFWEKWMIAAVYFSCHTCIIITIKAHMIWNKRVVSSHSRHSPAVQSLVCIAWTTVLRESETVPDMQEGFGYLQCRVGI